MAASVSFGVILENYLNYQNRFIKLVTHFWCMHYLLKNRPVLKTSGLKSFKGDKNFHCIHCFNGKAHKETLNKTRSYRIFIWCPFNPMLLFKSSAVSHETIFNSTLKNQLKVIKNYLHEKLTTLFYHTAQKWSFLLRISSVNVTKSTASCGFGHMYWRNP